MHEEVGQGLHVFEVEGIGREDHELLRRVCRITNRSVRFISEFRSSGRANTRQSFLYNSNAGV